jgi:hypothetical protein
MIWRGRKGLLSIILWLAVLPYISTVSKKLQRLRSREPFSRQSRRKNCSIKSITVPDATDHENNDQ